MHPDADGQQHDGRQQRAEALGQLAAGAADGDEMGGGEPGGDTGDQSRDPAAVNVTKLLGPVRFAQEGDRSEEHTSELQSLMRISYAVFCLKKKKKHRYNQQTKTNNQ